MIVLDDGHFGETSMQRSHARLGANLRDVARACGIRNALALTADDALDALFEAIAAWNGTTFAQLHIDPKEQIHALPPRDEVFVHRRFCAHLGLEPF